MKKKHFDEILDYGLFQDGEKEAEILENPTDVDLNSYKYFTKVKTVDGKVLLFRSKFSSVRPNEKDIGFDDGKRIMNGKFTLTSGGWKILVENGFLSKWLRAELFQEKNTKIEVEVETIFPYSMQVGNSVFINGKPASDGVYKISRWQRLFVKNGQLNSFYPTDKVEIPLGDNHRIFFFLLGGLLIIICREIYNRFDLVNSSNYLAYLFVAVFLVPSIFSFFYSLFYKVIFFEKTIQYGDFPFRKEISENEIRGYYSFQENQEEKLGLVKKNGKTKYFTSSQFGRNFFDLKKEVEKRFEIISKYERQDRKAARKV